MTWLTANEPDGAWPPSWYREITPDRPPFPPLPGDTRTEVAVIGAGITGLSAALHLAQAGRDVVLLEAARAGFGASGRNGGQIGSGFNWDHARMERAFGAAQARRLWDLAEEAKALTRALIAAHAPEADLRPGVLHVLRHQRDADGAFAEVRRLAEATGYRAARVLDREAVTRLTGSPAFAGGVLDTGAAYCQPLAYAQGLARAAAAAGVRLHERTRVARLVPGAAVRLETARGTVTADAAILAVNGYVDGLSGAVADRVLPINNYIAVTEPLGDRAPMREPVAVADDRFVVNYWWQSRDGRLVYGGGESYGKRFPADIRGRVRANLARTYPDLRDVRLTHAWGGTLAVTATRLPHVAAPAPGLLTAGGYSGHGLALSALAGRAMADRIAGNAETFDLLAALPTPRLPGGRWLGPWITGAALTWLSLRDRLGL